MCMHMLDFPCTSTEVPRGRHRGHGAARRGHGSCNHDRPVSAQQQHVSAAILATDSALASRSKDHRSHPALKLPDSVGNPLANLETLVGEVIARLEAPAVEPVQEVIARCNAALECYLETERACAGGDCEDPETAARNELPRLLRLLWLVDRADAALVVRAIRRVLARFDA